MSEEITKARIREFALRQSSRIEEVSFFLTLCRVFLEKTNRKKNSGFEVVVFYADWAAHPDIDRNQFVYKFLGDISTCFSDAEDYNIYRYFKIKTLIENILDVIEMCIMPSERIQINSKFIKAVVVQIFNIVLHRKIQLPKEWNLNNKDKPENYNKIIKDAGKVAKKVETNKKYQNHKLAKNNNYSTPVIARSICLKEIRESCFLFELEVFMADSPELPVIVLTGFELNIVFVSPNDLIISAEPLEFIN